MAVEIRDNAELQRFEAWVDGERAGFAEYRLASGMRIFPHTEIDDRFGGRGLGGRVIEAGLAAAREAGESVVPLCPFVQHHLRKHPEELDLVRDVHRRAFGLDVVAGSPETGEGASVEGAARGGRDAA